MLVMDIYIGGNIVEWFEKGLDTDNKNIQMDVSSYGDISK